MIREKLIAHQEARQARKDEAALDYESAQATLDQERPIDNLLTDDKEILGEKSEHLFRDRYRRKADNIMNKVEKAESNIDTKGMRERYVGYRINRTDIKIARVEEKLARSSDSFLMKYVNNGRRYKLNELKHSKQVLSRSSSTLETKRRAKPEELRKKIDEHVKKKVDAMYKKAQRQALRAEGIKAHNFVKKTEFIAKLAPDEKKKIVREAMLLVRKNNIEKGRIGSSLGVDTGLSTRKVTNEYGRTIE